MTDRLFQKGFFWDFLHLAENERAITRQKPGKTSGLPCLTAVERERTLKTRPLARLIR
jgi:hypothetical protein